MNIASKACLSIGGVGAIATAYIAGVKLNGSNQYSVTGEEEFFENDLYISVNKHHAANGNIVPSKSELSTQTAAHYTIKPTIGAVTQIASNSNSNTDSEQPIEGTSISVLIPAETTDVQKEVSGSFSESIVKSGDTFISLAKSAGVSTRDLTSLLYGSGISQKHFILKLNQKLKFEFNDEQLEQVFLFDDSIEFTVLKRSKADKFLKSVEKFPTTKILVSKQIIVKNSLSVDGASGDITTSEIAQVEAVLKSKIDFSVLPVGSSVELLSEQKIANDKVISSDLKAVKVISGTHTVFAFYYKGEDGAGYYDQNGVSLTPSFLRHPIKDPLITSKFNLNRKHPILKVVRPHWGTDYGHIGGTPILSISDAVVKFAGNRGGFGKTVILKHPQGIETLSAHMSKFAKGIRTGVKVKKGQVVGYVGKTGLSTGYHLHFELKQNGKRVSSLKVDLPTVDTVDDILKYRKEIEAYKARFI